MTISKASQQRAPSHKYRDFLAPYIKTTKTIYTRSTTIDTNNTIYFPKNINANITYKVPVRSHKVEYDHTQITPERNNQIHTTEGHKHVNREITLQQIYSTVKQNRTTLQIHTQLKIRQQQHNQHRSNHSALDSESFKLHKSKINTAIFTRLPALVYIRLIITPHYCSIPTCKITR